MFPPEDRATSTQMFCISEMQKKIVDTTSEEQESEESFRVLGIFSGTLEHHARLVRPRDETLRLGFKREDVQILFSSLGF